MKIVNLARDDSLEVFPDISYVKFGTPHTTPDDPIIGASMYSFQQWQKEQVQFSRDLRAYLKDSGISYAWPNYASVDHSRLITIAIIKPEDYSLVTLMSSDYQISRTHMMPSALRSFMFYLNDNDYEEYKDAIQQIKR